MRPGEIFIYLDSAFSYRMQPKGIKAVCGARVSDYTGFFWLGELVDFSEAGKLFTSAEKEQTETYIAGRMV